MLKYGILVKKDEKLAFELIKESYDKGRIESAYELGNYYIEGVCVEKDIKKAYEYYKKAADYSNHLKATKQLYVLIVNSNYTLATEKVAVSYLLRLKENNDLVAYDLLGVRYYYGMGVEKDIKKAYTYMQKCEELENARSTATLAYLYKVGNKELKIPTDYKKSEKLYKRTIKNGEHENYYQLGSLYYLYLKDYKKAYNTFIEGYNLGYINNAAYLGEMYIRFICRRGY